jgi:hypothetical protein
VKLAKPIDLNPQHVYVPKANLIVQIDPAKIVPGSAKHVRQWKISARYVSAIEWGLRSVLAKPIILTTKRMWNARFVIILATIAISQVASIALGTECSLENYASLLPIVFLMRIPLIVQVSFRYNKDL